jgi:hypothetical protein
MLEGSPQNSSQANVPRDLASAVHEELRRRSIIDPSLETLTELFEAMFFASLQTEESHRVVFDIVYIDPNSPDPEPPKTPPHDRWSCVSLSEPVPIGTKNFIKLAAASDPRTSALAVHETQDGRMVVWGLIDQGNHYNDYVNFDSDTGPERPGIFQASIVGVGHIVAHIEYEKVAELRQNYLVRSVMDVLEAGPVAKVLTKGLRSHLRKNPPEDFPIEANDWQTSLVSSALSSIRRLLLRVQTIRHGGAFLISPDKGRQELSIKYAVTYNRLRSALERHEELQVREFFASDIVVDEYLDKDRKNVPTWLYLDEIIAVHDLEEVRSELRSIIWFTSLLTRVDGLVLLNPGLDVQGFGVEITVREEPQEVFVAGDVEATESLLRKVDYQLYGTRHRSMMRYCAKYPGSVGLVISQDGDVRVMTRVEGRLVVWENIRVQLPTFVRPRKRRKK